MDNDLKQIESEVSQLVDKLSQLKAEIAQSYYWSRRNC